MALDQVRTPDLSGRGNGKARGKARAFAFRRRYSGFTLTELVVTLIVAGILAATILPRWQGETGFEARGFRDETAAALRYAQKTAVASRRQVCISFTAGGLGARLDSTFGAGDCLAASGVPVLGPDGAALAIAAPAGVGYAPTPAALTFDPAGRPGLSATITVGGLAGLPITVEAETGYVH